MAKRMNGTVDSAANSTTTKETKMKKTAKKQMTTAEVFALAIKNGSFVEIDYVNSQGEGSTRMFFPLSPITFMPNTNSHLVWGLDTVVEHENAERSTERATSTIKLESVLSAKLTDRKLDLEDGTYIVPANLSFHLGSPARKEQNASLRPATETYDYFVETVNKATGEKITEKRQGERRMQTKQLLRLVSIGYRFLTVAQGKGELCTVGFSGGAIKMFALRGAEVEATYSYKVAR